MLTPIGGSSGSRPRAGRRLKAADGDMLGLTAAPAGTPWYALVPGAVNLRARIARIQIDNGATANPLYLMRPINPEPVQFTDAFGTGVDTVTLSRDPSPPGNTIAAGDQCIIQCSDGTYRQVQVAAWTAASLSLQFTANLPAAVVARANLFNLGVHTDTDPRTTKAFPKLEPAINGVSEVGFGVGFGGRPGDPLLVYCPNATDQTVMNFAEYAYT